MIKDKKIDLIKLDIEMHEPEAIEGMLSIIERDNPIMFIEILTDEIAEKLDNLIDTTNYVCFSIDEDTGYKEIDGIKKSDYYNILLMPKGKMYLI